MRISARLAPAILAAAAALAVTTAGAANAVTPPKPVTASTLMAGRDDSGGNGNWAKDTFTRVLTITQQPGTVPHTDCSPSAVHCYAFTASLKDGGWFQTIPGAYTPNQGGSNAGKRIHGIVDGTFHGSGDFATFYATALPDAHLVPRVNLADANPSSTWPELAFPHGTGFTGLNEDPWGYFYSAGILVPVLVHGHVTYQLEQQQWADTSVPANDDGQGATAGNITG